MILLVKNKTEDFFLFDKINIVVGFTRIFMKYQDINSVLLRK